jgi:glycerol-3-phosphate dehydrogenase
MVKEALKERGLMAQNAAHLVKTICNTYYNWWVVISIP